MPREKIVKLFDNNHISVIRTENMKNPEEFVRIEKKRFETKSSFLRYNCIFGKTTVTKILKSPLGFYYSAKVPKYQIPEEPTNSLKIVVTLWMKKCKYEIVYFQEYGDLKVGLDTRPWNLVSGDGPFNDRNIDDLKSEIDKVLELISENNIDVVEGSRSSLYNELKDERISFTDLRDMLYTDIFGNPRGVPQQTDREKVIAHGFDTKTSFRNV